MIIENGGGADRVVRDDKPAKKGNRFTVKIGIVMISRDADA